jgi:DNA-binding MarR family transcriptional regulator
MVDVKHRAGIWRKLIDLLHVQRYWMEQIAADFDMTPQMAIALQEIPAERTITMKELAAALWCDASNTTGVVDRLEAGKLVERRASATDRRIKCLVLTSSGKRVRRRIAERMSEAPPAVAALSAADQSALESIVDRALHNAHVLGVPERAPRQKQPATRRKPPRLAAAPASTLDSPRSARAKSR